MRKRTYDHRMATALVLADAAASPNAAAHLTGIIAWNLSNARRLLQDPRAASRNYGRVLLSFAKHVRTLRAQV